MARLHTHVFILSLLVSRMSGLEVEVAGELSFGIKISHFGNEEAEGEDHKRVEESEMVEERGNVTVAPGVECLYQYPDEEQFNAMLSNMMNELTKVFVHVRELMVGSGAGRRRGTRFIVVDKKDKKFFEEIYANMAREYTNYYVEITERVSRLQDPCQSQEELKEMWRGLLEHSLGYLRRASVQCIDRYLQSQGKDEDYRTRYKLGQFLMRELRRARAAQLQSLCDHFQLCYNDLM